MTNTLPIHRLDLPAGAAAAASAAYVRAPGLAVERLEQTYLRIADEAAHHRYDCAAPALGFTSGLAYDENGLVLGFTSRLAYDENGLVLDYPGIARRAG